MTFKKSRIIISLLQLNNTLSRVAEGIGPVTPGNLVSVKADKEGAKSYGIFILKDEDKTWN